MNAKMLFISYNDFYMEKKLKRSSQNQILAGVLAGFAEYFGHDATIWRLGFVIFLIVTGLMPGLLLYLVAWVIMPLAEEEEVAYTVME